jgi:hypothetical protein
MVVPKPVNIDKRRREFEQIRDQIRSGIFTLIRHAFPIRLNPTGENTAVEAPTNATAHFEFVLVEDHLLLGRGAFLRGSLGLRDAASLHACCEPLTLIQETKQACRRVRTCHIPLLGAFSFFGVRGVDGGTRPSPFSSFSILASRLGPRRKFSIALYVAPSPKIWATLVQLIYTIGISHELFGQVEIERGECGVNLLENQNWR